MVLRNVRQQRVFHRITSIKTAGYVASSRQRELVCVCACTHMCTLMHMLVCVCACVDVCCCWLGEGDKVTAVGRRTTFHTCWQDSDITLTRSVTPLNMEHMGARRVHVLRNNIWNSVFATFSFHDSPNVQNQCSCVQHEHEWEDRCADGKRWE